jgi:outer membrane protein assembly factor BamB
MVTRSVFRLATSGSGYVGLTLLGDSILYAVSAGDALYRLDINGNTLYTLQVGGNVLSTSSVAYDTNVYIASTDRNLYAFSKFGAPIWPALPLGGVLSATAAVDSIGNRLYVGVQNRNFFAVNRTTGLVAWSYFSDAPIMNSAVVTSDRKLVFSTQAGTVYGFDLANLPGPVSPAWTLSLGDTITSSPAIDADGFFYVGTKSGKVAKISMQQGSSASTVWQTQTGGAVVASPVIDGNGTLYVGSLDSKLYAINTADGNIKWSLLSTGPIRSTAALSNSGIVYFGNDAGQLSAVDSAGNLKWKYLHPTAISSPLLYNKGTLYAAGEDAVVLAFFDGEDPFSQAPRAGTNRQSDGIAGTKVPVWGTFQGNNQRTGAQSSQIGTGVSAKPVPIPKSFSLSQNYPNPFNPTTVIRFDVPGSSQVVLKVYSLFGQEVATLVNERKSAGSYEISFDAGSRLASGLYFYRMQAGNFTETKKLLLIK